MKVIAHVMGSDEEVNFSLSFKGETDGKPKGDRNESELNRGNRMHVMKNPQDIRPDCLSRMWVGDRSKLEQEGAIREEDLGAWELRKEVVGRDGINLITITFFDDGILGRGRVEARCTTWGGLISHTFKPPFDGETDEEERQVQDSLLDILNGLIAKEVIVIKKETPLT